MLRGSAALIVCLAMCLTVAEAAESPELLLPVGAKKLADVSPDQAKRIEEIKRRPTSATVSLVEIRVAALKGESARVSLPDSRALTLSRRSVEKKGPNDFTWIGSLPGVPGAANLVFHNGNLTGTIRDDGDLYRIESIGGGVHALIKVDQTRFPPDHPPSFKQKEQTGHRLAPPRGIQETGVAYNIDVLVAYTPAVTSALSTNLNATIALAVSETNQAYANSNINAKITLVDSFEVNYSESGKTFETILADFEGMSDVQGRRNSSGADVMVLLIDKADYCGLSETIGASAEEAYSIVYYDCATGNYSFGHEVAHLQGAHHDPANDSSGGYCHGLQHASAPTWRTIMAYPCDGSGCDPRIQYFSNPYVTYGGVPTGTADTNFNARCLNESAATVSRFRVRPCPSPLQTCLDGRCCEGPCVGAYPGRCCKKGSVGCGTSCCERNARCCGGHCC